MIWSTLIWVVLYFLLGLILIDIFDMYDSDIITMIMFVFWPVIVTIWTIEIIFVVIPYIIADWIKRRRNK